MVGWILLGGLVGYGSGAVATARYHYGVQRAALIARKSGGAGPAERAERFRADDQEHTATAALLLGLGWPVTLPAYLAHRGARFAITSRPRRTDEEGGERRSRAVASRDRIQELEQALGLGPGASTDPAAEPGRAAEPVDPTAS